MLRALGSAPRSDYGSRVADSVRGPGRQARFEDVDLSGSRFRGVDLAGAQFRGVDLSRVRMRGVDMSDGVVEGDVAGLTINGVEVGPLIDAELDRRSPDRAKMRPTDAAGFREAWDVVERLWDDTVQRAERLDPALLHESVDEEWSFIETLRHLLFATDAWIARALLGDPSPWHPLDLPWDELPDMPEIPRDRDVRPTLDEVLALRRERTSRMRQVLDDLTDASLDAHTEPVDAPGWPGPHSFPVRQCLLVVLSEEWQHRRYAERDLDALERR